MENNKYFVSYVLSNDNKSLITFIVTALPQFGEIGKYNIEEAGKITDFIHNYKVPDFNNNLNNWDSFRDKLNKDIFDIYGK